MKGVLNVSQDPRPVRDVLEERIRPYQGPLEERGAVPPKLPVQPSEAKPIVQSNQQSPKEKK
jgi:hypothetical protein